MDFTLEATAEATTLPVYSYDYETHGSDVYRMDKSGWQVTFLGVINDW
jgi:hypothetical protein